MGVGRWVRGWVRGWAGDNVRVVTLEMVRGAIDDIVVIVPCPSAFIPGVVIRIVTVLGFPIDPWSCAVYELQDEDDEVAQPDHSQYAQVQLRRGARVPPQRTAPKARAHHVAPEAKENDHSGRGAANNVGVRRHAAARDAAKNGLNEELKHHQVAPVCRILGYLFLT